MVGFFESIQQFTQDQEPDSDLRRKEEEDIWEEEKEEDAKMPVCQLKLCGLEDKEFLEDYLRNIENKERSTRNCIIDFTWLLKVINSRTKKS